MLAVTALAQSADNIISTCNLFGGTYNQFHVSFPRFGIEGRSVGSDDRAEEIEAAIDDNTKAIYLESIGNPRGNVPDFKSISAVAKKHGVALIVDNTFGAARSEEHTSELQSRGHLVCRLLLEKKQTIADLCQN